MAAGFISEWWPASNRNGGRLHLRAPQACPISGQVEGYEDRLTCSGVGAAGSVCSNSGIVRATAIEAWLSVHRPAVGHSGDGDIGHGHCARLGS